MNLTPILKHPLARARVGEMCEQVRADRDRARHKPAWWNQPDPGCDGYEGCGALAVVAVFLLGVAVSACLAFRFF